MDNLWTTTATRPSPRSTSAVLAVRGAATARTTRPTGPSRTTVEEAAAARDSRDGYDQSGVDFSAFGGGRSRRQAGAGCKLYVGNISFQMTQADLQSLFSPFGRVQDTYLPVERDSGRPRGFGFVTFSSSNEAQAAIQALDGTDHDGRQLRVNVSEPRQNWAFY